MDDDASFVKLIVRHPPEPTTTVSRSMEDEQVWTWHLQALIILARVKIRWSSTPLPLIGQNIVFRKIHLGGSICAL